MLRTFGRLTQPPQEPTLATLSWLQLKSDGTQAVYGQENVSSVTDNGAGDYTVTWTIPYATASSYAVLLGSTGSTAAAQRHFQNIQSITATSVQTRFLDWNAAASDPDLTYLVALGEF